MAWISFTDDEMRQLRAALGTPPGSPDPTAADVLAVLTAENITRAESHRWYGFG